MDHEDITRMLFVDAIIGVGFPNTQAAVYAVRGGLTAPHDPSEGQRWSRTALEELDTPTLQDLYTGLKLHEVTHAH